jgi:hypothetical protein
LLEHFLSFNDNCLTTSHLAALFTKWNLSIASEDDWSNKILSKDPISCFSERNDFTWLLNLFGNSRRRNQFRWPEVVYWCRKCSLSFQWLLLIGIEYHWTKLRTVGMSELWSFSLHIIKLTFIALFQNIIHCYFTLVQQAIGNCRITDCNTSISCKYWYWNFFPNSGVAPLLVIVCCDSVDIVAFSLKFNISISMPVHRAEQLQSWMRLANMWIKLFPFSFVVSRTVIWILTPNIKVFEYRQCRYFIIKWITLTLTTTHVDLAIKRILLDCNRVNRNLKYEMLLLLVKVFYVHQYHSTSFGNETETRISFSCMVCLSEIP